MPKIVPLFGFKVMFDPKKGGLRKNQPLEWHQLAFFLNASEIWGSKA